MKFVEPRVFLVGETTLIKSGVQDFLNHINVPNWKTNAPSDPEELIEIMGRICYNSFSLENNPNLTRTTKGNDNYIKGLVKNKHGSVAEHAWINFIFTNVSRILTHELVRHCVGVAKSQKSGRFTRDSELGLYIPTIIRENEEVLKIFTSAGKTLEEAQHKMAELLDINNLSTFKKREATSAIRRIAPFGHDSIIGMSLNLRSSRWVLEERTNPKSEEEIRFLFGEVGKIVLPRYPNMFWDFTTEMVKGYLHYKPKFSKI